MPDNISAAAIALAFAAGGSLRNYKTTPLMSNAEGPEAMRKAATCGYKPVPTPASAAAVPRPRPKQQAIHKTRPVDGCQAVERKARTVFAQAEISPHSSVTLRTWRPYAPAHPLRSPDSSGSFRNA